MSKSCDVVEDPSYRAVGKIYVDGDEAEVDSLPESVGREVSDNLLVSFVDMGNRLRQLEANPEEKTRVIEAFIDGWDETNVERSIMKRAGMDPPDPHPV